MAIIDCFQNLNYKQSVTEADPQNKLQKSRSGYPLSCWLWTHPASSPTVWKVLSPGWNGPIVTKLTIMNSFRTAKAATKGNHSLCLKSKPPVKCHWHWPAEQTLERQPRAPAELSILGNTHRLPAVWKVLSLAWKGLIGTIVNYFRSSKVATKGNHRLCLKSKPPVICQWSWLAG